jgi:hypothetical protein
MVMLLMIGADCSLLACEEQQNDDVRSMGKALLNGKLAEGSDRSGPIIGNQAESSDKRETIRSRSGLCFTADENLYCTFSLEKWPALLQ